MNNHISKDPVSSDEIIETSGMSTGDLSSELAFYKLAYSAPDDRRERGFGWEKEPSKVVVDLVEANKLAENASGQRFLDLGTGEGRHLEYFSRLGFDALGVDFCQEAVDLCNQRFADHPGIQVRQADLVAKEALADLGEFDLVLDWSVLDHIRPQYVERYLANIVAVLKAGGHAILAEFDPSLPGLADGADSKEVEGHYSKSYSIEELIDLLARFGLQPVDARESILEDEVNNIKFNTVLFKKI